MTTRWAFERCAFTDLREKRAVEHAAGRLAAARALRALTGRDVVIARADSGQPVVEGAHVSISHHDGLAVAAASSAPIGVDLVTIEAVDDAFLTHAFVDGELAGWEHPMIAFGAKEACAKLLGLGFALPLLGFAVHRDGTLVVAGDVTRHVHVRVRRCGTRALIVARP